MDCKSAMVDQSNIVHGVEVGANGSLEIHQTVNNYNGNGRIEMSVPKELPPESFLYDRRSEKEELDKSISAGCQVVYIQGLPGVGKTVCLKKWANGMKDCYPDGQLYFDVEAHSSNGVVSTSELQRRALRSFQVEHADGMGDCDVEALYRTITANKRLLIVLDNVRDVTTVDALRPNSSDALMVIAGQSRFVKQNDRETVINLGCFSRADAQGFLAKRLSIMLEGGDDEHAIAFLFKDEAALEKILRSCDGLPIALEQVTALLASGVYDVADVANVLGEKVGDDALSPLLDAAVSDFDDCENCLYHLMGRIRGHSVCYSALRYAFDDCPKGSACFTNAVSGLLGRLLVDSTRSEGALPAGISNRRLSMHRQVSFHAGSCVPPKCAAYSVTFGRLVKFYRFLAQSLDFAMTPSRLRLYKLVDTPSDISIQIAADEAQEVFFSLCDEFAAVIELAVDGGLYEDARAIAEALWVFCYENRMFQRGIEIFENGLCAARVLHDADGAARMLAMGSRCYLLLGDEAVAREKIAEALDMAKESSNWVLRGSVKEFAGNTEREAGNFEKALRYYAEAREEYLQIKGDYPRGCILADYLMLQTYLDLDDAESALLIARSFEANDGFDRDAATSIKLRIARARVFERLGDLDASVEELNLAINLCDHVGLRARRAEAFEWLGKIYGRQSSVSLSLDCLNRAAEDYASMNMMTKQKEIEGLIHHFSPDE